MRGRRNRVRPVLVLSLPAVTRGARREVPPAAEPATPPAMLLDIDLPSLPLGAEARP